MKRSDIKVGQSYHFDTSAVENELSRTAEYVVREGFTAEGQPSVRVISTDLVARKYNTRKDGIQVHFTEEERQRIIDAYVANHVRFIVRRVENAETDKQRIQAEADLAEQSALARENGEKALPTEPFAILPRHIIESVADRKRKARQEREEREQKEAAQRESLRSEATGFDAVNFGSTIRAYHDQAGRSGAEAVKKLRSLIEEAQAAIDAFESKTRTGHDREAGRYFYDPSPINQEEGFPVMRTIFGGEMVVARRASEAIEAVASYQKYAHTYNTLNALREVEQAPQAGHAL